MNANIIDSILKEKNAEKLGEKIGTLSSYLLDKWLSFEKRNAVDIEKEYKRQEKLYDGKGEFMSLEEAEIYRAIAYSVLMTIRSMKDENSEENRSMLSKIFMPFS